MFFTAQYPRETEKCNPDLVYLETTRMVSLEVGGGSEASAADALSELMTQPLMTLCGLEDAGDLPISSEEETK